MNGEWDKPSLTELLDLKNKGLSNIEIGKIYDVSGSAVSRLITKYGITNQIKKPVKSKVIDLLSKKFGRLTVINRAENTKQGQTQWVCNCDCGKTDIIIRGYCLTNGHTKSCGCYMIESSIKNNTTHGKTGTKVYKTWVSIKERCYNEHHQYYNLYGGRGIKVSDEWLNSFEKFYKEMGEPPTTKHQIDRIDTNGNYEKGNCRWVTSKQNSQNRRKRTGCSSIYKGVYFDYNKWVSNITLDGEQIILGFYDNEIDAALEYNKNAIKYFGEFAMLNEFIKPEE